LLINKFVYFNIFGKQKPQQVPHPRESGYKTQAKINLTVLFTQLVSKPS